MRLPKQDPGVEFEDLDMISKLLARKKLIEEVKKDGEGDEGVCAVHLQSLVQTCGYSRTQASSTP